VFTLIQYEESYNWTQRVPTQVTEDPDTQPIPLVNGDVPLMVTVLAPDSTIDDYFQSLNRDTCDYNQEELPIGYNGKLWIIFPVLKLRVICRKLVVYCIKIAKKEQIVEAIMKTYKN
jgi:hypothetical protein